MKLDVLSAMHFIAEAWRLITPNTIKNLCVKCDFSNDRFSNNDDSAMKLSKDEEDDWYSLLVQSLGVQVEGYITCDNVLKVCGIQTVNHMLDHNLTRPEEKRKEKVSEHKATFLDALKGLEAAKKHTCHFYAEQYYCIVQRS
jgi:hypothetical protein